MSVADASSSAARAALLRHAACVLAPLAPRTPHSDTFFTGEPYPWMSHPSAARPASMTASDKVGWPWMIRATSG